MCLSRTEFALCFPYKLLTLSTGNMVIFKSALVIPSEVLPPHWDGLSIFPEVIPDSPSSSFQWWQRLLPLAAATRAACELGGIPQEQEDSSTPCSPACLTRDELPSCSVHQAQEDHTRLLHLGERSGAQHALASA